MDGVQALIQARHLVQTLVRLQHVVVLWMRVPVRWQAVVQEEVAVAVVALRPRQQQLRLQLLLHPQMSLCPCTVNVTALPLAHVVLEVVVAVHLVASL